MLHRGLSWRQEAFFTGTIGWLCLHSCLGQPPLLIKLCFSKKEKIINLCIWCFIWLYENCTCTLYSMHLWLIIQSVILCFYQSMICWWWSVFCWSWQWNCTSCFINLVRVHRYALFQAWVCFSFGISTFLYILLASQIWSVRQAWLLLVFFIHDMNPFLLLQLGPLFP